MTIDEIKRALEEPLFDSSIVRHSFAPFLRDYDVVAEIFEHQYLYRFTHCTSLTTSTALSDELWRKSWDDLYIDLAAYEHAGRPDDGVLWATCFAAAYPGAKYIDDSPRARDWSKRLGKPMHEVRIETNLQSIELIFHDLRVRELKPDDPGWVK